MDDRQQRIIAEMGKGDFMAGIDDALQLLGEAKPSKRCAAVCHLVEYAAQRPNITCPAHFDVTLRPVEGELEFGARRRINECLWGNVVERAHLVFTVDIRCVIRESVCDTKIDELQGPFHKQKLAGFRSLLEQSLPHGLCAPR